MPEGPTAAEPAAPPEMPPSIQVLMMSSGLWQTQVIYVVAKLGICDLVADGPRTVANLAETANLRPERLFRVLRAAAGLGILRRTAPETFAIGPLGGVLRSGVQDSVRHLAIMNGEEHYTYWGKLLESLEGDEIMFDRIFGKDPWTYHAEHPEQGETFNRAMSDLARNVHIPAVMQFDFGPHSTVMDVAGGTGTMLSFILQTNPHLRGILFDLEPVVEQAAEVLEGAGVGDRCERVAGDYTESIPEGADVYMVSLTLQDLPDDKALVVLRNVREAMGPDSLFVAVELVVPDDDRPHLATLNDLNMMLFLGAKIRTRDEYADLYERAGMVLKDVVETPSPMSLVIGEPA